MTAPKTYFNRGFFLRNKSNLLAIVVTVFILLAIPFTVFVSQKVRDLRSHASIPQQQDLDVTFIERTPRYQRYNVVYPNRYPTLASGTENLQRNPNVGDIVTFTAHFKNAGVIISNSFTYKWFIDGVQVSSGSHNPLLVGQADTATFQWAWQNGNHDIKFVIDPGSSVKEISSANNQRQERINAIYLRIQVEQSVYDNFNNILNLVGSYSFEDWVQAQLDAFNQKLIDSGGLERVRIDQIFVQPDGSLPDTGTHSDSNWDWDGSWGFTWNFNSWCMPPNCGSAGNDITFWNSRIQAGLLHEWSHQMGMAHSYDANIDIATNNTVNGQRLVQSNPDIVGVGGDDVGNAFSQNIPLTPYFIYALNSNVGYRRGYYADYLFNLPDTNILQFKDVLGNKLANASLRIWQSNANTIGGAPIVTGTTDLNGQYVLPNQPLPLGNLTTATGHTLKPNPFGVIDVVGSNGLLLFEVTVGSLKEYKFLTIHDFNLAYFRGSTQTAIYSIQTSLIANANPTNLALNQPTTSYCGNSCAGPASAAVDGDKTSITTGYWAPINESGTLGDWWQVDLGALHNIYKVIVYAGARNNHDWYSKFHLETSPTGNFTGEQWTVATETNWDLSRNGAQSVIYTFSSPPSRYIRLVSDVTQNYIRLQELEVYELIPCHKVGDTNGDCIVNSDDLAILLSTWGSTTDLRADFDADGKVTSADLALLLSNWGK